MTKFDRYVEKLSEQSKQSRLHVANAALQKSLRERTEEEVYDSIYRRLGAGGQKVSAVLA